MIINRGVQMIKENNNKIEIYKVKDTNELKKALMLFLAVLILSIIMVFLLSNLFKFFG